MSKTWIAVYLLSSAVGVAQEAPREWIDPATHHRIIRLSDEPGSKSLYFHQNAYTAKGDLMVFTTPTGLSVIDLHTRKIRPLYRLGVTRVFGPDAVPLIMEALRDTAVHRRGGRPRLLDTSTGPVSPSTRGDQS